MKKSTIFVIVGLLIIVFGIVVWQNNKRENNLITNNEMLQTNNGTEIIIESDVEYYPGAKGYFVRPKEDGIYPGVVMIHENRGLRSEIKATAEQLAREGYIVLAVDLLGGVAEDQDGARALTSKFDQKKGIENMKAAASYLRSKGAPKVASLGWCFGGKQSVELAISGEKLDATVVYYGGNMATTTQRLGPIKWPVLGIFGDKDQAIPVATVKTFENSLKTLGIENEIYIYPGVGHAFANPSGMNYAPEATKDAWGKTVTFLTKHLKGPVAPASVAPAASTAQPVKNFTVTGSNFSLSPGNITVRKGDRVNITFENSAGTHDLKIDEFNVATKKLQGGQKETISFTADKTGKFEYYCSVGNHRAMGMQGTLTVE